jgi:transposase
MAESKKELSMSTRDRDRLKILHEVQKRHISQKQAAIELGLSTRWVRKLPQRLDNRGRPWHHTRVVVNGVLWVLGSGAPWRELPNRYPPCQTCHRRFQQWMRTGKLEQALNVLAHHLRERGQLQLAGSFLDELPEDLSGDKAWDSDQLEKHLVEEYRIEMIAPNRRNRGQTQDGRPLRRYRRR